MRYSQIRKHAINAFSQQKCFEIFVFFLFKFAKFFVSFIIKWEFPEGTRILAIAFQTFHISIENKYQKFSVKHHSITGDELALQFDSNSNEKPTFAITKTTNNKFPMVE